jgi:hypothetical protein
VKTAAEQEMPELIHKEKVRRLSGTKDVAHARECAVLRTRALSESLTGVRLNDMETDEAVKALGEYEQGVHKMVKDEKALLQKRARAEARATAAFDVEARGKARAKAKAKGEAKAKAKGKAKAKAKGGARANGNSGF